MKLLSPSPILLVLCFCLPLLAQGPGGGARGGRKLPTTPGRPNSGFPGLAVPVTFVSGKVVVDDGTDLGAPAAVQSICRGAKRTETYTDSHGAFSFQFSARSAGQSGDVASDSSNDAPDVLVRTPQPRDYYDCELQALLPGFSSERIQLGNRLSLSQSVDVGRVLLHRMAQVEGFTISATSAQAPGRAQEAYRQGLEKSGKGDWNGAREAFKKAVEIYPNYAVAWYELGRLQLLAGDSAPARASFGKAVAADARYLSPYLELSRLAMQDHQWDEVLSLTNKALALNPVSFPALWFFNASANFLVGNMLAAEKSARQAVLLDSEHKIPRAEYVLAMVLTQRKQYDEAATHMRKFLSLEPNGVNAQMVARQLAELERLRAVADAAPVEH